MQSSFSWTLIVDRWKAFLLWLGPDDALHLDQEARWQWISWLEVLRVVGVLVGSVSFIRTIWFFHAALSEILSFALSVLFIWGFPYGAKRMKNHEVMAFLSIMTSLSVLFYGVFFGARVFSASLVWFLFLPVFAVTILPLKKALTLIVITSISAFMVVFAESGAISPFVLDPSIRAVVLLSCLTAMCVAGFNINQQATKLHTDLQENYHIIQTSQDKNHQAEIEMVKAATYVALNHEINNPAAVALGNLSLLRRTADNSDLQMLEGDLMEIVSNLKELNSQIDIEVTHVK